MSQQKQWEKPLRQKNEKEVVKATSGTGDVKEGEMRGGKSRQTRPFRMSGKKRDFRPLKLNHLGKPLEGEGN